MGLQRRPEKCLGCWHWFTPKRKGQVWCTPRCRARSGMQYIRMQRRRRKNLTGIGPPGRWSNADNVVALGSTPRVPTVHDTLPYVPYKDPAAHAAYMREWVANRRKTWLSDHGPCKRCGSWEDLTVDHIDPKNKISHKVWSWSTERMEIELAKCQVLCSSCHKKKTAAENAARFMDHGAAKWGRRGCKCLSCKTRNAEAQKKRRASLSVGRVVEALL